MPPESKPLIRPLDFQPVHYRGETMWLLRDPLHLAEGQVIFPAALARMLPLCDGTRTVERIRSDLAAVIGIEVPPEIVPDALEQLDEAYLLQNERYEQRRHELLAAYRSAHFRSPALANVSYPGGRAQLAQTLDGYRNGYESHGLNGNARRYRGIVSPHIDFARGGPVYARVWNAAEASILDADIVLIFGTDHNGSPGSITLTQQAYATPYGVLPGDAALIGRLADAIGQQAAFAEELNHRHEHSVEFSAVWLHHIFSRAGRDPCVMIPILVGSFHHFLSNGAHPAEDATFNRFLAALREETAGRRVLAVASVDLAHVGPAFGDVFGMDEGRRARLREEDDRLMSAVLRGDAADFYRQIWAVRDRNRICGFAPLYLMLRYLETSGGVQMGYDQCAADDVGTSLVSICGLLLGEEI